MEHDSHTHALFGIRWVAWLEEADGGGARGIENRCRNVAPNSYGDADNVDECS
jgi:hypothetical protein